MGEFCQEKCRRVITCHQEAAAAIADFHDSVDRGGKPTIPQLIAKAISLDLHCTVNDISLAAKIELGDAPCQSTYLEVQAPFGAVGRIALSDLEKNSKGKKNHYN